MVSYRVYFRNFFGVVGQDEFEAPDDGSAYAVAETLSEALSDFCTSFELWEGGRMIATRPVISLAETVRLAAQAIVVEREEAIHNSKSAISLGAAARGERRPPAICLESSRRRSCASGGRAP